MLDFWKEHVSKPRAHWELQMPHLYEAYIKYKYGTASGMSGDDTMEQNEPVQQDPHNSTKFSIAMLGLSGK